jgi:hypothetical protein
VGVLPAPGRTSVRITGDHYQWLIAWQGCLTILRDDAGNIPNSVICVGVELDSVGNLDDVVLHRQAPPHTYSQVKYAVDSTSPVNEDYLLKPSGSGGPGVLQKIAQAWRDLTYVSVPVDLALISNRAPDPDDPLLALRDARTQLLMPKAGEQGPRSARGAARARWASITGLSEDELLRLLGVLRFDLSRDPSHLWEHLRLLMLAAGLRHDDNAINAGTDWVAQQVRNGHKVLTPAMIANAIESLGLAAGPTRAILSIATLKPDPVADQADYAIDWSERFDGTSAYSKRRPKAPATWAQLQEEIEGAPGRLPVGTTAVAVTGSLRQAPAFLVGSAFRMVTGTDLAVLQRGHLWSTNDSFDAALTPQQDECSIDLGQDLAVAIAVATDPTQDVLEFIQRQQIPVSRLLVLRPPAGAKDNSVPDGAAANALALGIRDVVRRASLTAPRIHLFLAGPLGLALLLGHRWNRLRPTVIYEDIATEQFYESAFTIDA